MDQEDVRQRESSDDAAQGTDTVTILLDCSNNIPVFTAGHSGSTGVSSLIEGEIDEIRLSTSVRSAAELQRHYANMTESRCETLDYYTVVTGQAENYVALKLYLSRRDPGLVPACSHLLVELNK